MLYEVITKKYDVPYGAELVVTDGQNVKKGTPLYNHDPYNALILTDIPGRVRFVDLIDGSTLQQVTDEQTVITSYSIHYTKLYDKE